MDKATTPTLARKRLVFITVLVGIGWVTWQALSPRPDWHDAPIELLPLTFHAKIGGLGYDTVMHFLGVATLTPALLLVLPELRTPNRYLLLVGGTFCWAATVELLQGFLPYRTFELTDILANLSGSLVALAAGTARLHRKRAD